MRSFLIFKILTASNSTLKLALFHLTYRKNRTVKIRHQKLLRGLNECTWIAFFFNTKITFKIKITGKSMMKLETAENCFFIISHLIRNSNSKNWLGQLKGFISISSLLSSNYCHVYITSPLPHTNTNGTLKNFSRERPGHFTETEVAQLEPALPGAGVWDTVWLSMG